MDAEKLQIAIVERIQKGRSVTVKKGVPKRKSPTGKAIPAVKSRVSSLATKTLMGKSLLRKWNSSALDIEDELRRMRDAGVLVCTNGYWWVK